MTCNFGSGSCSSRWAWREKAANLASIQHPRLIKPSSPWLALITIHSQLLYKNLLRPLMTIHHSTSNRLSWRRIPRKVVDRDWCSQRIAFDVIGRYPNYPTLVSLFLRSYQATNPFYAFHMLGVGSDPIRLDPILPPTREKRKKGS